MSYDIKKKKFEKTHFWFCEIEVNGQSFRFCEDMELLPFGLDAVPELKSQSITPAKIDMAGGLGIRATSSVSIGEFLDEHTYGTFQNPVRFWANWRARNPNYQGGRLSIFSGYIDSDGAEEASFSGFVSQQKNYIYNSADFIRRDYVIESFALTNKGAAFTAKDSLKLASNDRVKIPKKSSGKLAFDIIESDTLLTLVPLGVGDLEYPASGFGRMGKEVVSFTRTGDDLTLVRGEYSTVAETHSESDDFQLCKYYNDTVDNIVYDILVNDSGVDAAQITIAEWNAERVIYLPSLYETLITEPTGASALLKELGQTAPHFLFYDDRVNKIKFSAVKPPSEGDLEYNGDINFLEDSVSIKDRTDLRISTVIVNYGQKNPTEKLDETSNFKLGYIRITPDSIAKYNGIQSYKVVNSRWINDTNTAAAVILAARWGRRFEETPREITFKLDSKDSDLWTGDAAFVKTPMILDINGDEKSTAVQVISAGEARDFNYKVIEHGYGVELPEDLNTDDPNEKPVYLRGEFKNLNLRDAYNFPTVEPEDNVVFYIDYGSVVGSVDNLTHSIDTGVWEPLNNPIKIVVYGIIAGKGGDGKRSSAGDNGGPALILRTDIRLENLGTIGGGGGGGGGASANHGGGDIDTASGGGGAGFDAGGFEQTTSSTGGATQAENGGLISGGSSGSAESTNGQAIGGDGGGLGLNGQNGTAGSIVGSDIDYPGGLAGKAIDLNGFSITYQDPDTDGGDIRGLVS